MNNIRLNFRKSPNAASHAAGNKNIRVFDNGQTKKVQINSPPGSDNILVQYDSDRCGIVKIRIFSLIGYEVYAKANYVQLGINLYSIDCSSLNVGTYIVETAIRDSQQEMITTYNKIELSNPCSE